MAAKTSKAHVAVTYDSHSDTTDDSHDEEESADSTDVHEAKHKESDGSVADAESDIGDAEDGKSGMADVMAKILKKQTPKKGVILGKAKTDRQLQYLKRKKLIKDEEDEVDKKKIKAEENTEEKPIKERRKYQEERERLLRKKMWEEMGHIKPSILDKEKERHLKRIATQGIVQLFNAVRKQQKNVEERLKEVGTTELKREKVMKSVNKGEFLDMLKSTATNTASKTAKKKEQAPADDDEDYKPGWKILRDDFMMGGSMKDWDKQSDDEDDDGDDESMEDNSSEDDS